MSRKRRVFVRGIVGLALLVAPGSASAAIVTNGDFETGNFSGWQLNDAPDPPTGSWLVYTGASLGGDPIPAPPQGNFAAAVNQSDPGRHLLYQDLTLPPGGSQYLLSMYVYYDSNAAISSQPNLDFAGPPNQQYRIDVMRPSAPLDSVASGDILRAVFQTVTGDPPTLAPTVMTTDLKPFAGQTVRLRFAEVDNQDIFHAATDAVAVKTNAFTLDQVIRNKKKGTAQLPVTVPDAGTLTLTGSGVKPRSARKAVAVGAGTTNLLVKATGKKKRDLKRKGKAKVSVTVTYTPNGLSANSRQTSVKLKKKLKKK